MKETKDQLPDERIQGSFMRLIGRIALSMCVTSVPLLAGAMVALEVGQATQDQQLIDQQRRLDSVEHLTDQIHAMDVDLQWLVRTAGHTPATRP